MSNHCVTKRSILQITPVTGVRAVYMDDNGEYSQTPIIALALCESQDDLHAANGHLIEAGETYREVCGLESLEREGLVICEESSNFVRYLAPGEELKK